MMLFLEYLHFQNMEFYPETYMTFHDISPLFDIYTNSIHIHSLLSKCFNMATILFVYLFIPLSPKGIKYDTYNESNDAAK